MSNADNHSPSWSEADIQRYLKGELTARGMHELEKAALDDPFLSDALEGLAASTVSAAPTGAALANNQPVDSRLKTDLEDLRARLAARTGAKEQPRTGAKEQPRAGAKEQPRTEAKEQLGTGAKEQLGAVPWFRAPAFRVAAAVILLAGLGFTAYYTLFKQKDRSESPSLAKTTAAPPATPPPTKQSPASTTSAQSPASASPAAQSQALAPASAQPPSAADSTLLSKDIADNLRAKRRRSDADDKYPSPSKTEDATPSKARLTPPSKAKIAPPAEASYAPPTVTRASETEARTAIPFDARIAAPSWDSTAAAGLPNTARSRPMLTVSKDSTQFSQSLSYNKQQGFYNNKYTPKPYPLLVSGRVVDAKDRPLAGASLFVKGYSNFSTTTDNRGHFSFKLPSQDTARQMMVALAGYQQTSFSLNPDALTNNIIRLQEAKTSLDEVVVTGYGMQRKETLAAAPSDSDERLDSAWLKVYPVIGKLDYLQYLAAGKKTLRVDSAVRGNERISFQVDQKGHMTDFKIEQSLSPAHDAGLIQLISGGSPWRLLHGKKARVVVSLSFP